MEALLLTLERILTRERDLFSEVLSIESMKTSAIMDRDGASLKELSEKQESLLEQVNQLENDREKTVAAIRKTAGRRVVDKTLNELMNAIGTAAARRITKGGRDLAVILRQLNDLNETNKKLINDNMDFFNILLSQLKNGTSLDTGYGCNGREENVRKSPLLFNQIA